MSVTSDTTTIIAIRDKLSLTGRLGQTKVKRYWPGKAPVWAQDEDVLEEEDGKVLEKVSPPPPNVDSRDDPRLRRLAESRVGKSMEDIRADHRRIRHAEIVSTIQEENEWKEKLDLEEEDEDAGEERRRRIREKLLQREKEEVAPEDEDEEMEEEESEYETDSEEEELAGGIAMVKPVFVMKAERDTVAERERLEEVEKALEEMMKRRMDERKVETKKIVVAEIRKDEEIEKNLEMDVNIADVDTDDELNEAEEYEAWKIREIMRIKKVRDDKEAMIKEREEIDKVRNMTDEERREWERRNPKPLPKPKQKWTFMQKYFHKGAFFQSNADDPSATAGTDHIFTRDFSAPTGEDKLNKAILPKVMQVKDFGRKNRVKWRDLVNEDTTDWNNRWMYIDPLRAKYNKQMAGMNMPIERPKGRKKLKDWEYR